MAIVIHRAELQDAESLRTIARQAYAHYRDRMDRDPAPMHAEFTTHILKDIVFVAKGDDAQSEIHGYAVLINQDSGWLLDNIAVEPSHKSIGIGTKLLASCEAHLIDLNVAKYRLYTNVVMRETLAWYLSLGFVEIDRRMEDGFHRVYLERHLND